MQRTSPFRVRRPCRLGGDTRGTAAIEMAIVLPVLLLLVFGIVTYGSWLAISHSVQQAANEGGRAALGGLTVDERASLARSTANDVLVRTLDINASKVAVSVQDDGATLIVDVVYDAAGNPLLMLPIIPAPSTRIERKTVMKLTGL